MHDARDLITSRKPQKFPKNVFSEDTPQKTASKGSGKNCINPDRTNSPNTNNTNTPIIRPKQSQKKHKEERNHNTDDNVTDAQRYAIGNGSHSGS